MQTAKLVSIRLMGLLLAGALVAGCESNKPADNPAPKTNIANEQPKAAPKPDVAKPVAKPLVMEYAELPLGKRICVVGTKESAEHVKAGNKPASHVAEIGYGPKGETIYFENKPEGMEAALKAEYAKRHAIK